MYHSIDAVSVPCGFRVPADGNHPWVRRGSGESNVVASVNMAA